MSPARCLKTLGMAYITWSLAGCRVIDVCSDEFVMFLDRSARLHHAKLLAALPTALGAEEAGKIRLNFGIA